MTLATTTVNFMGLGFTPMQANFLVNGIPAKADLTLGTVAGLTSMTGAAATSATGTGTTVTITGGSGGSTSGQSGSVILAPGAVVSGVQGALMNRGVVLVTQAAQAAKTTSTTLTAAELLGGIITGNQGAAGAATYTLPLGTDLEAALPTDVAVNDSFDFSLINISTVAAEDITVATNTGWTLVGALVVESKDNDRANSSGMFRVRRTAASTFTLYRLA